MQTADGLDKVGAKLLAGEMIVLLLLQLLADTSLLIMLLLLLLLPLLLQLLLSLLLHMTAWLVVEAIISLLRGAAMIYLVMLPSSSESTAMSAHGLRGLLMSPVAGALGEWARGGVDCGE